MQRPVRFQAGEPHPILELSCCRMRQGQEIFETERKASGYLRYRFEAVGLSRGRALVSLVALVIAASQASFPLWSRSRELLDT